MIGRVLRVLVLAAIVLTLLWFLQKQGTGDRPPEPVASPTSTPGTPTTPTTPPTPSSTPSSSTSPSPTAEPAGRAGARGDHDGEGAPVGPTAAAVPRDREQADRFETYAQAAVEFMDAFARPGSGTSPEQWWARVKPLLSDVAQDAYAGTDPRSVPFSRVTGEATILPTDAPSGLLMLARVPTDGGYYLVEMVTGPEGIRVSRATPEARS